MRPAIQFGAIVAALALLGAMPTSVLADARVTALDGRGWPDVIADLVQRLDSEGTEIPLCVRDDAGMCTPCGAYGLSFDAAGASAFEVGTCDAATGATYVRLAHRTALFDHDHAVPVPRPVAIHAALPGGETTESTTPRVAGSGLGCSVQVRPYVRDFEHGVLVYLGPDAYDVRVARMQVRVDPSEDGGFVLSSTDGASTVLSYDVIERATGSVVLVGRAMLACTSAADVPATAPGAVSPEPAQAALALGSPTFAARASGMRIRPHDSSRDVARAVGVAGIALAAGSAITLIGIGLGTMIHVSPYCARYDRSASVTAYTGPTSSAAPPRCVDWVAGRPSETPAELTWAMVGTLGVGAFLGIASVIAQALMPSRDDRGPRMLVDVGPNGGSVGLALTF